MSDHTFPALMAIFIVIGVALCVYGLYGQLVR